MKRTIQREQVFKILFRAEFNDASEMPGQEELYFDSGDMEFTEKDKIYITRKVNRILERRAAYVPAVIVKAHAAVAKNRMNRKQGRHSQ